MKIKRGGQFVGEQETIQAWQAYREAEIPAKGENLWLAVLEAPSRDMRLGRDGYGTPWQSV